MEVIVELLQIFKKEGLRSAGLLSTTRSKMLPEKFMLAVLDEKLTDDDAIAKKIYGTDRSDPKYRNLKKRVKRMLLDVVPNLDSHTLGFKSDYNKAYYDCLKACQQLTLLSRIAAYDTSLNIVASKYNLAVRYQFYDILKQFSYFLIKINAIRGNVRKVKHENKLYLKYSIEAENIREAQITSLEMISVVATNSHVSKSFLELFEQKLSELEKFPSESFEYKSWVLYLKTHFFQITGDITGLSKHMHEYESIFTGWKNFNPGRLTMLVIQKSTIHLTMKEYEMGLEFISNHLPIVKNKLNNWGILKRFEFCLAINYEINHAIKVLDEITNSQYFQLRNNVFIYQLWLIHNAYLQFMLQYENHPRADRFNLYKFINEVDIYSKDKPGYNFSIIVIELMFYLLSDNRDRYIDRMTALMSYRLRHLNSKAFKRSNVFAQLLLSVDKYSFSYEKIKISAEKKYNYLASLEDRLSINEWEIISYDRLWEIVLDLLSRKQKSSP
jgi:hypothetical protein